MATFANSCLIISRPEGKKHWTKSETDNLTLLCSKNRNESIFNEIFVLDSFAYFKSLQQSDVFWKFADLVRAQVQLDHGRPRSDICMMVKIQTLMSLLSSELYLISFSAITQDWTMIWSNFLALHLMSIVVISILWHSNWASLYSA